LRLDRLVWSFKEDVAIHTHRELIPSRNLDRGLNVQIASCDLGARLAEFLTDGASGGLSWCRIRQSALAGSLRDLERGGEHAREHGESNNPPIVAVYLIPQPSVAVGIEAYHAVKINGGSVGVDDAAPGNLHAILPVCNAGVVLPDQTRSLGNQEVEARGGVVDVRGDQCFQFAGEV
jgi:hypothetical protein